MVKRKNVKEDFALAWREKKEREKKPAKRLGGGPRDEMRHKEKRVGTGGGNGVSVKGGNHKKKRKKKTPPPSITACRLAKREGVGRGRCPRGQQSTPKGKKKQGGRLSEVRKKTSKAKPSEKVVTKRQRW